MFIYIKQNVKELACRCVITRVDIKNGYYYQILFSGAPSAFCTARAIRRCAPYPLPVAGSGIRLLPKYKKRLLCQNGYNIRLLINAFAYSAAGCKNALIADKDARLAEHILLPLSKIHTLYIQTEHPEIYEQKSDMYLKNTGTAPVLLTRCCDLKSFCAVLSPFYKIPNCEGRVFGQGGYMPTGNTVRHRDKTYDRALSAALYTVCGDRKSGLCIPEKLSLDGHDFTPDRIKMILDKDRLAII